MAIEWVDVSDGNGTVFRATVGALALDVVSYGALGWLAEVGIPDKREKHSLYVVLAKIPRPSSECPSSLADAQAWAIAAAQRAVQPLIDAAVAEAVAQIETDAREGCGDTACVIAPSSARGMSGNGGCQCAPWTLALALRKARAAVDAARAEGAAEEREACARVADAMAEGAHEDGEFPAERQSIAIARAIRARKDGVR